MKNLLFISFLILSVFGYAQTEVQAEVSAEEISVNQYIEYNLKIINPPTNGGKPKLSYPKFEGFEMMGPPSQFQNSSFQMGPNGTTSNFVITISFRLKPKKTGTYTFEPSSVTFGTKKYASKEITVKVVKGESGSNYPDKPMFARISVSKSTAYLGEPIQAVYKIYSRFQFEDITDYEPGAYDGFQAKTIYDILKTQNAKIGTETINGKRYQTIEIKRVVLFGLETGELKLTPFKIKGIAQVDFFRSYSDNLVSNSPKVTIKELPDKPKNFNGAVGNFSISAEIGKNKIEAGEAFDLTIKIKGKGNTHLLEQPFVDLPPDFEIYGDPEVIDKTEVTAEGAKGSLEYNFVIRANTRGEYTLGPFKLDYFNPSSGTYETAITDSFAIEVKGGVLSAAKNNSKEKNKVKQKIEAKEDIRFITRDAYTAYHPLDFLYGEIIYWFGLGIPLFLSGIIILLIRKKRNRSEEEIASSNRRQASKMAIKVLKNARTSLKAGDNDKFYEELHLSMISYLKNKLNLDLTDMNRTKIQDVFKENGLEESIGGTVFEILDQCQMARYAPIDQEGNEDLIAKAETCINQIQKGIK